MLTTVNTAPGFDTTMATMANVTLNSLIAGALLGTAASLPALQVDPDGGPLVWFVAAALAVVGVTLHLWNASWRIE